MLGFSGIRFSLVAVIASSGLGPALTAQVAPAPLDEAAALMELLNTPITTATRSAQKSSDAPATVVVVTQDQIRRRNYRSLLDLLKDLPEFQVDPRATSNGWANDVTVRGIPGVEKFIIMMDGTRISGATNDPMPIMENLPLVQARQVEVVYGPASALYGADALSGVVNIITRKDDSTEATIARGDHNQATTNVFWSAHPAAGLRFTFAGQWFHDDNVNFADYYPDYNFSAQAANNFPNPFGGPNISAPPGFAPTPSTPTLTQAIYSAMEVKDFTLSVFRNYAQYSSSTNYLPSVAIFDPGAYIGMGSTIINARYKAQVGDFALESSLTTNSYQVNSGSNYQDVYDNFQPAYKYAQGTDSKAEQQVIWTGSDRWTLTAGASYDLYTAMPWSADLQSPVNTATAINGIDIGTPFAAVFYPLRYTNLGSYLQAQVRLTDTLNATVGARYDVNSRYGNTFNPRLGLVWNLGTAGTLKALYGSAFLAPSPFTQYQHYGSFTQDPTTKAWSGSFWVLPNPTLDPMTEKTAEVAYLVPMGTAFHLSASLYKVWLQSLFSTQDFIQGVNATPIYPGNIYQGWPVAVIQIPVNQGKQTNQGGNVKVDYVHAFGGNRHLTAYINHSFISGKVDPLQNGTQFDIGGVTPSMTRFGLDFLWDDFSFSPTLSIMGRQRLTASDASGNPMEISGYQLLNLPFRYQVFQHVEAFVSVSNALDKRYRSANDYSEGFTPLGSPQDPRRYSGGVVIHL